MYAIIRTGGKQAKVQVGDVLDVERLRVDGEVTFTPLLVVDDDGNVMSKRADLADVKVVAKVIGGSQGPKVDIFKYKAKTGYRRRGGHRQKYTQIEVVDIDMPGAGKAAKAEGDAKSAAKPKSTAKPKTESEPKTAETDAKADTATKSAAKPKTAEAGGTQKAGKPEAGAETVEEA